MGRNLLPRSAIELQGGVLDRTVGRDVVQLGRHDGILDNRDQLDPGGLGGGARRSRVEVTDAGSGGT
jgi:hypothetical protein